MKTIFSDRIPRKYSLFWNSNQKAIIIQIHKDCLWSVRPVGEDSPWFKSISRYHDADGLFDSFSGNLLEDSFGFNQLIRRYNESADYIEFFTLIPRVKQELNFVCEDCGGTGRRDSPYHNESCIHCDGSRKKYVFTWRDAYLTVASLNLLFNVLELCDETSAKDHQHITVSMLSEREPHGSSLHGYFGISFVEYIASQQFELENIILPYVKEAMITTWGQLLTVRSYGHHSMRARADNSNLYLSCPGDACGIHPSDHDFRHNRGMEFTGHNVDSPVQSLTLLAGIAALVGQADFYISAQNKVLV